MKFGKGMTMKNLRNKEILFGSIALIILCMIALALIVKREFPKQEQNKVAVEEIDIEEKTRRQDQTPGLLLPRRSSSVR